MTHGPFGWICLQTTPPAQRRVSKHYAELALWLCLSVLLLFRSSLHVGVSAWNVARHLVQISATFLSVENFL